MLKQQILDKINEVIIEEKGTAVDIDNMFIDSNLDSLGTMIVVVTLDAEFGILGDESDEKAFEDLDIPNLTIRSLVQKCKSSTINTSKELSD